MEKIIKTVGIYNRVSTGKQEESLEEQKRLNIEWCKEKKYEIAKEYDEIISGGKKDRPKFQKMLEDVKNRKFDAVVVQKLDRFSRSVIDLVTTMEILKEHKIDFISIIDNIETVTPQGKLVFHIMAALAEFERHLISQRTKVGIERAKREGKICHRPRKEVNLDRVVELYDKGINFTEIAATQKVSTVTLWKRIREANLKIGKKIIKNE